MAYSVYEGAKLISELNSYVEAGLGIKTELNDLESCPIEDRTQQQQDRIDELRREGVENAASQTEAQLRGGLLWVWAHSSFAELLRSLARDLSAHGRGCGFGCRSYFALGAMRAPTEECHEQIFSSDYLPSAASSPCSVAQQN